MSKMSIANLLLEPESKTLEFKRDTSSLIPILKTVIAFANTAGGIVIIGQDEKGFLMGVGDPLSEEEKLANCIADSIAPALRPDIEMSTVRGKTILMIRVAHQHGPFYLKKEGMPDGVYVRFGSTTRKAFPEI